MSSYSNQALPSAVLNSTNWYRTHHEAANLSWDATLAQYAQSHAQKCIWEHSGGPYGENLASGYEDPALAVDAWGDEEHHYNYQKSDFSEETGHYTQLVWKGTKRVGCGAVECRSGDDAAKGVKGWFLVCEYDPPGNVIGLFRGNVSKPGMDAQGRLGIVSAAAASRRSGGGCWSQALGMVMAAVVCFTVLL